MNSIVIKSQEEFDALPDNFDTYTLIKIRAGCRIVIAKAWNNASVVALGNASVDARGNASVVAWENASVVARDNASVEAWGNALVRAFSASIRLSLHGFSMLSMPAALNLKFKAEKTCVVQRYEKQKFLAREGVPVKNGKVTLYKRVSHDFKTQEGTENETLWTVGSVVTHLKWNPDSGECGPGKYHACSRPYFCDQFRNVKGDRYIAISVNAKDLHEWEDPQYPHKIAFREGEVLYECDSLGRKVE